MRPWIARVALWMLLLGCQGSQPAAPDTPIALGWVAQVALHPVAFEQLMQATSSEGWIAFHQHDYHTALGAFNTNAKASKQAHRRSLGALHTLYSDLAPIEREVTIRTLGTPTQRAVPDTTAAIIHDMAADCAHWRNTPSAPFPQRRALHLAVSSTQLTPLRDVARMPLHTDPSASTDRAWLDPCVLSTLAHATRPPERKGEASPTQTELANHLFGSLPLPSTLSGPPAVHPTAAREWVRTLDTWLAAQQSALRKQAPPQGVALLTQLGLIQRARQELLLGRARHAIQQDQPHLALAYLNLARDATVRAVGPENSPELYALIARAQVQAGHIREALDALAPLEQAYPEVAGLREITGTLSVLQTIGRQGKSLEN